MSAGFMEGRPQPPFREPFHIRSHATLLGRRGDRLAPGSPDVLRQIDAVIVPAHRHEAHLAYAARAAKVLSCPLIVLCSDELSADDALQQVHPILTLDRVRAVDVRFTGQDREVIPTVRLATDSPRFLDGLGAVAHGDVSGKRNLGLLIARAMGWRAIMFLDDDVKNLGWGLGARRVRKVLDLLNRSSSGHPIQAVGWRCSGFPDNSAVCHAYRDSGHYQDVFVGGGGLAVRVGEHTPFFPNVYNEDWLFLHPLLALRSVLQGGTLHQDRYDPYHPDLGLPNRQEFGDVLAEGVFRLLHARPPGARDWEELLTPATEARWWAVAVDWRHRFLDAIAGSVSHQRNGREQTLFRVVREARSRLGQFEPHQFAEWVKLWAEDQTMWSHTLAGVHPHPRPLDELPEVLRPYQLQDAVRPR